MYTNRHTQLLLVRVEQTCPAKDIKRFSLHGFLIIIYLKMVYFSVMLLLTKCHKFLL